MAARAPSTLPAKDAKNHSGELKKPSIDTWVGRDVVTSTHAMRNSNHPSFELRGPLGGDEGEISRLLTSRAGTNTRATSYSVAGCAHSMMRLLTT